jgi:hypothetical protein
MYLKESVVQHEQFKWEISVVIIGMPDIRTCTYRAAAIRISVHIILIYDQLRLIPLTNYK